MNDIRLTSKEMKFLFSMATELPSKPIFNKNTIQLVLRYQENMEADIECRYVKKICEEKYG